MFCSRTIKI